ncbi:MAG: hypothetical protein AAGA44_05590 [Pseudomonadota bacterium]
MPALSDSLQRREAISSLLKQGPVQNQQALVDALRHLDLEATQSSVSRDLKSIGAIKTPRGYELPDTPGVAGSIFDEVAEFIRSMRPAGPNLLVIRTAVGAAQRVALALDRSGWPEMVGNIGGDDTVFVATESAQAQRNLLARLEQVTT